jgi:hypothetical protein
MTVDDACSLPASPKLVVVAVVKASVRNRDLNLLS